MNKYEYQRSRSLFDLGPKSLRFILSNIFCSKATGPTEEKFNEPSGRISAPKRQYFAITDPGCLHNTLVDCMTLLLSQTWRHLIIRYYHMGFCLSPAVSTRDSIISPRALARGLIMVEGWYLGKWPKSHVIICLSHIQIRNLNYFRRKIIIFHTKTKKFGHVRRVTSRNSIRLTSR